MTDSAIPTIDPLLYRPVIARALQEDLGQGLVDVAGIGLVVVAAGVHEHAAAVDDANTHFLGRPSSPAHPRGSTSGRCGTARCT